MSRLKLLQRRILTFLCFLMAVSMIVSIFIFIDSVSLEKWDEYNDIGPVAMKVEGENLESVIDEFRNIPHVTNASTAETAQAYLRMDMNSVYQGSPTDPLDPMFLLVGQAYSFNPDFTDAFPTEFELTAGRYPRNSSEIAIPEADATYWSIPIGRMMNYSHFLNSEKRTVFVVGLFRTSEDSLRSVITDAVAIVTSDVLNPETVKTKVYINIDREIISPADPKGSLNLLGEIESAISSTNLSNSTYDVSYIDDYIETGLLLYIDYLSYTRSRQVSRAQTLILLVGLFSFLGTRFNVTMRKEELAILRTRGATKLQLFKKIMSELLGISFVVCIFAIILGSLMTKLAWISHGYLTINWLDVFSTPLLITYDLLIILVISSFIVPVFGYLSHNMIRSISSRDVERGRLARLTRSIRLIRWDVSLVIVVVILLAILYLGGNVVSENPILSLIAAYSTIPVFIAIASIFNKSWHLVTKPISRIVCRAIGKVPANIGIRGVSKSERLSLPIILILVVVVTSNLADNAIATSLPNTQMIHSRFIIGGDLSFHLDSDEASNWTNFNEIVSAQEEVVNSSFISVGKLSLSEGTTGIAEFVAINPAEYSQVGYSYDGSELNNCAQTQLLEYLESNQDGAVLTADIASEYNLIPGDILRVFSFGENSTTIEFNILGTTYAIPRPIVSGQPSTDSIIGTRKIWLNRKYIETLVDLSISTDTFLCVKTTDMANSTSIGLDVLADTGTQILSFGEWSSVTADVDSYVSQSDYKIDRSIDRMISISMIFSFFVGFVTYQISQRVNGREEFALLKSIGISESQITRIRFAEFLGLVILSILLVLVFGPLNVANLLRNNFIEYETGLYVFPLSLFTLVNWYFFIIAFAFIITPSLILIHIFSKRYKIDDIAGILREVFQNGTMMEGAR